MGNALGRKPKGLARIDRGVMANEFRGDQGSRFHPGGKYEMLQAEGEASEVVARHEGPKGVGKGSKGPRGPGEVRGARTKPGEVEVGPGTSGRGQGMR